MLKNYLALDLETTGLNPKKDKIIEIGAVRVELGRITGEFSSLINPGRGLEPLTAKLTGITDEMLDGFPPLESVLEEFLKFGEKLPLVGHHIIFDFSFMKKACVQAGFSYERFGVDTLKLSRQLLPQLEKRSLLSVCGFLGIPLKQNHRALADAKASSQILEQLQNCFQKENPELFSPKPLVYQVKKEKMMTKHQKEYLIDFIKCNRIRLNVDIDRLTRSEASRLTDQLICQYGKWKPEQKDQTGH